MMSQSEPDPQMILNKMRAMLGDVPAAMEKAATADPRMVIEQTRSSAFAMPEESGGLDAQTRTLVYLAVALATSDRACTLAMLGKASQQGIPTGQLLETFHITRFAAASRVLGEAEPLFDLVNGRTQQGSRKATP
jgi:alkylhydroperoxidase/carboxymuconolactone decarboxylase family protein YurZ